MFCKSPPFLFEVWWNLPTGRTVGFFANSDGARGDSVLLGVVGVADLALYQSVLVTP